MEDYRCGDAHVTAGSRNLIIDDIGISVLREFLISFLSHARSSYIPAPIHLSTDLWP